MGKMQYVNNSKLISHQSLFSGKKLAKINANSGDVTSYGYFPRLFFRYTLLCLLPSHRSLIGAKQEGITNLFRPWHPDDPSRSISRAASAMLYFTRRKIWVKIDSAVRIIIVDSRPGRSPTYNMTISLSQSTPSRARIDWASCLVEQQKSNMVQDCIDPNVKCSASKLLPATSRPHLTPQAKPNPTVYARKRIHWLLIAILYHMGSSPRCCSEG